MYYVLAPYIRLAGYLKLPYGLFNMKTGQANFYTKQQYDLVMKCDGEHVIDAEHLDEADQQVLTNLLTHNYVKTCDEKASLAPYQKYIYYDNRYKSHVQWSVTGRCNYRCKHCFMSAPDAKFGHPSLEQCKKVVDGLAASGIKTVSLTGGEPLVRKDLFEIIDYLLENDIAVTTIYTNGALLDRDFMEKLKARKMRPFFQLSFDGVGCHDWMRGIEGAEETVISAFDLINEYGCRFGCSMVLHKHNVGVIRDTVLFLAKRNCLYAKINIAEPCGKWATQAEHFLTMPEMYQAFLAYIPQYVQDGKPMTIMLGGAASYDKAEGRFSIPFDKSAGCDCEKSPVCGDIRSEAYISPDGYLLPCMSMIGTKVAEGFPNVFETPLPELLRTSYYTQMMSLNVADYIKHNQKCAACPYVKKCCGGCRAIAAGSTGTDFLGVDHEACTFFTDGWYEKFKDVIDHCKDAESSI